MSDKLFKRLVIEALIVIIVRLSYGSSSGQLMDTENNLLRRLKMVIDE